MLKNRETINTFLLAVFYAVGFYLLNFLLEQRGMVKLLPDNEKLLYWDAGYYHEIAKSGYQFKEGQAGNTAFYMLLPMVWKMLGLNPMWMAFVNVLFFATGFAIFTSLYKLTTAQKFMWLTMPTLYYCFIPYTEALFVLLMSVALLGMHRNKRWLIWTGLFFLSLTRPVTMVLVPAFLITELITNQRKDWLKAMGNFFTTYALPLIAGQVFFIWYQYYETGVWFAFFKVEKYWGHEFSLPALPFNSMYGPILLWLNALAMFLSFVALLLLVKKGWQWLVQNKASTDKPLVVSYLYMTAMLLITVFFMPKWATGSTNVYDILRYVFCTPFFFVFLHRFTTQVKYKGMDYLIIILLSNAFWLLFGSYYHIGYVYYFNFCTVILILYMLSTNKRYEWVPMAIAAINLFVQVNMFQLYLAHTYHG
jgi:hypothetical protein